MTNELLPHCDYIDAKIKDTELCDLYYSVDVVMYVMPLVLECTCSTRKLAAIRACC